MDWHPIWGEFSQLRPNARRWLLKMNQRMYTKLRMRKIGNGIKKNMIWALI